MGMREMQKRESRVLNAELFVKHGRRWQKENSFKFESVFLTNT